ncbi:hypothetical protein ACJX0J_018863, partial [Zea mays]
GLKTLRSQLYSAAEYFELAYTQQDEKQAVTNNLKEYAVKALVNTVDHLGSISFKVSSLIDQRFSEATDADLRISCIHQRTQASQACVDREGISQQSLVITAPKYHKRYILPAQGQSMPSAMPNFREMNKVVVTGRASQMHQVFSAETRAKEKKQPSLRKLQSIARLPSQRARSASPAQRAHPMAPAKNATPTNRDKRSESPVPSTAPAPLTRSASLSKKASLLKTSSVRAQ